MINIDLYVIQFVFIVNFICQGYFSGEGCEVWVFVIGDIFGSVLINLSLCEGFVKEQCQDQFGLKLQGKKEEVVYKIVYKINDLVLAVYIGMVIFG